MNTKVSEKSNALTTILFTLIAGFISILLFTSGRADKDYLWSIKLGEHIVNNGIYAPANFSWLHEITPLNEIAHSWLYNIIIYLPYKLFISFGVNTSLAMNLSGILYCFLTAVILYLAIRFTIYSRITKDTPLFAVLAVLCGYLCCNPRAKNLGFSLFIFMLYAFVNIFIDKKVYKWLPLVAILWANIHGGSIPMLFAFEALFIAVAVISDHYKRKENKGFGENTCFKTQYDAKTMASVLGLSIVAGLLNPYGHSLYTYCFKANDALSKKYVSEWQPASVMSTSNLIILGCVILYLLFYICIEGTTFKQFLIYLIPVGICFVLSGKYCRMQSYGLLSLPLLFNRDFFVELKFKTDRLKRPIKFKYRDSIILSCVILIECGILLTFCKMPVNTLPTELTAAIKEANPNHLYNSYNDGAYLCVEDILYLTSAWAEVPGKYIAESVEFERMILENKSPEEYLSELNIDAILLRKETKNQGLRRILRDEWKVKYEDDTYIFYTLASE